MALVRMTSGSGEISTGILFPLAKLLTRVEGVGAEQACFLIAALAYGLLVPATLRLLRTIGFEHGLSLGATAAALTTPVLLLGASLPGDFAPGALGATWLLTSLFRPRERVRFGYQWRAVTLYFLACLLRPENALLLPAVVWAVTRQGGKTRGPLAGVTLALVATFALRILITGNAGAFWDTVLSGRQPSWSALPVWAGYLTVGLGAAGFGLYTLLFGRRLPEETPAPVWMVPWCLVALAPMAGGVPGAGPVGAFLVPAAAVGLADWLARREQGSVARRALLTLVAAQVVLASAVRVGWEVRDPGRGPRASLRQVLASTDLVVTRDPTLGYWCSQRWGLETLPSLDRLGGAPSARIVLLDTPAPGAVLHEVATVHVLRNGALVRVEARSAWRP